MQATNPIAIYTFFQTISPCNDWRLLEDDVDVYVKHIINYSHFNVNVLQAQIC